MIYYLESMYIEQEVVPCVTTYAASGGAALILRDTNGQVLCAASVNLQDWGEETPPKGQIWVKSWSENEGMPDALEDAGIATPLGEYSEGPHDSVAHLMQINEELLS